MKLPTRYDLMIVSYNDHGAGKGLCYAPFAKVEIGDEVVTTFGRGIVTDIAEYCSNDNKYMRLVMQVATIDRVLSKITPVAYEELEDVDISD